MKAPSYDILLNILNDRGLPATVAHQILLMVYHQEHRKALTTNMQYEIVDAAFSRTSNVPIDIGGNESENLETDNDVVYSSYVGCVADPKKATNHFYNCDCCEKHQYNKAVIAIDGLFIVTKPCVFTAFRYTGRVPPEQWYTNAYGDDGVRCHCNCRHTGREAARIWLKQTTGFGQRYMLNPTIAPNPIYRNALGITSNIMGFQQPPHGLDDPDDLE